jgi:hypothetical protein
MDPARIKSNFLANCEAKNPQRDRQYRKSIVLSSLGNKDNGMVMKA